jgi:pyruvate dehydrogenase E2 component (dihydrolipoamide acetyltransferase)
MRLRSQTFKMATRIFIPKMGTNIEEVEIGKVYVRQGQAVKKGELLFEMVTNKATFDIEADASGVILKLDLKEKEELKVLTTVGYIGKRGEKLPKATTPKKKSAPNGVKGNTLTSRNRSFKLVKFPSRKKAEINNLKQTKDYLPSSVTLQFPVTKIKNQVKKFALKNKIRLSMSQYLSYFTALALSDFPCLNASYSPQGVRLYSQVNLGIAVNPGQGLLVLVIKNANHLSLKEFSVQYNKLIMKAIKNRVSRKNLSGGTFTVTSLSDHQIFRFTPVINKNQAAILGIGAEYDSCKLKDKKLVYDPKINLTLVFDHRVLDGKYASEFLQKLVKQLAK